MALTGKVMGTTDRTVVRFFRASEAERVFGTTDLPEIRKAVGKAASGLVVKPSRVFVDGLHLGVLVSWYWTRDTTTTATARR